MPLRLAILLCLVPFISGFFCIHIPAGVFQSGNTCVPDSAYVGQRISNSQTGKSGTVKELHGRSERCQNGATPIVATVEYE